MKSQPLAAVVLLSCAIVAHAASATREAAEDQGKPALFEEKAPAKKAPEKPEPDPVMAYIEAKDKAELRIQQAELQRAKLLFLEKQPKGMVLAFAIPQPPPDEIKRFMAPLKHFIATTKDEVRQRWAEEQVAQLELYYGFGKGKLRAVYLLIPADKEESWEAVSFPAETEAECEKFIREDLKPVKLEVGKPYQAREGVRSGSKEITPGWRFEQLVKGRGLDESLENWTDWHLKRGKLK